MGKKKKRQPTLFQDGSRYVFVTPESPTGFKNSLFVAWEGETPDSLTEVVKTVDQLQALLPNRVDPASISAEWRAALEKVTGLSLPEPTPESAPEPTASAPEPIAPAAKPEPEPDPIIQMAPLCVTWVWAFGIATVIAMLLGIIN